MSDAKPAAPLKSLLVILAFALLLVGGYFGYRYFRKPPTQPDVEQGRAVAEAFLNRVRSGKAGEAWDATTTEFKSIEGRESFIRKAKSTAILKDPLHFASSQQVVVQDEP